MNDQPTPDALLRASAYLDGEVDAAEIAAIEADPAVMAEVAQLRSLQESIRDVVEPTSHARDTAIAAALVEFDRRRHPAPVVRTRPRPAYSRWLAVAAAVAGLAALGAVVSQVGGGGGGDDDAAEVADEAGGDDLAASAERTTGLSVAAAPQPESVQSDTMLATGAPAATFGVPDAAAEEAATAAPPETTTAASAAGAADPPTFDPNTPIPNELELGRIGRQLLTEWEAGERVSKTGTACDATSPDVVLLSDALFIVDGVARPVLIAGNRATAETFAVDPDTCVVIATGR
jgi:hypothetical protein